MEGTAKVKTLISGEEFNKNLTLDLSDLIETRKGVFEAKYISWANALRLLRERHPTLDVKFDRNGDGHPYFFHHQPEGDYQCYVSPRVISNDGNETPPILYPVMDHSFKAITCPSIRDISDSMQRALVKCIAHHTGIGLSLYIGEDIPTVKTARRVRAAKIIDEAPVVTSAKPQEQIATEKKALAKGLVEASPWLEAVVPMGKNKGKSLSELTNRSIGWYAENYEVNLAFDDSVAFRAALDTWMLEQKLMENNAADEEDDRDRMVFDDKGNQITDDGKGNSIDEEEDEVPF